jgi:type IV pilus assembly protein PilE
MMHIPAVGRVACLNAEISSETLLSCGATIRRPASTCLLATATGDEAGFSLTELMIVLVIVGVLVLLALPKLTPIVTKAKATEAKLQLRQIHALEQSFRFENDRYSAELGDIGFEQQRLITDGGQARYKIMLMSAGTDHFLAQAVSVVDFDGDGSFNTWIVDEQGIIRETVPD